MNPNPGLPARPSRRFRWLVLVPVVVILAGTLLYALYAYMSRLITVGQAAEDIYEAAAYYGRGANYELTISKYQEVLDLYGNQFPIPDPQLMWARSGLARTKVILGIGRQDPNLLNDALDIYAKMPISAQEAAGIIAIDTAIHHYNWINEDYGNYRKFGEKAQKLA